MSLSFQERFRDRVSAVGKQGELSIEHSSPIPKQSIVPTAGVHNSSTIAVLPHSRKGNFTQLRDDHRITRPIKLPANPKLNTSVQSISELASTALYTSYAEEVSLPVSELQSYIVPKPSESLIKPIPKASIRPDKARTKSHKYEKVSGKLSPVKAGSPVSLRKQVPHHKKSLSADQSISMPEVKPAHRAGYIPCTLSHYKLMQIPHYFELRGLGSTIGSQGWLNQKLINDRRSNYAKHVGVTNANKIAFLLARPKKEMDDIRGKRGGKREDRDRESGVVRTEDVESVDAEGEMLAEFVGDLRARLLA